MGQREQVTTTILMQLNMLASDNARGLLLYGLHAHVNLKILDGHMPSKPAHLPIRHCRRGGRRGRATSDSSSGLNRSTNSRELSDSRRSYGPMLNKEEELDKIRSIVDDILRAREHIKKKVLDSALVYLGNNRETFDASAAENNQVVRLRQWVDSTAKAHTQ